MILSFDALSSLNHPWLTLASLVAALAYGLTMGVAPSRWSLGVLYAAWGAHLLAIGCDVLGWGLAQTGARFGFAPALSVTMWLIVAVYLIEGRWIPLTQQRRVLAGLGLLTVILAWLFPGELRPAAGHPWAPLHWILGIASYGLFGVAVFHAVLLDQAERQMRASKLTLDASNEPMGGVPLLRWERMTFRLVGMGFVTLSGAIVLGIWHTTAWRWDHKTVFSLLGWAVFAGLLLGRRCLGWRGRKATRWVYAGAALLLLGYVGSRFVLEVILQRPY